MNGFNPIDTFPRHSAAFHKSYGFAAAGFTVYHGVDGVVTDGYDKELDMYLSVILYVPNSKPDMYCTLCARITDFDTADEVLSQLDTICEEYNVRASAGWIDGCTNAAKNLSELMTAKTLSMVVVEQHCILRG